MGAEDVQACLERLLADDEGDDRLARAAAIDLVAGTEARAFGQGLEVLKASGLQALDRLVMGLALRLALAEEAEIVLGYLLHPLGVGGGDRHSRSCVRR